MFVYGLLKIEQGLRVNADALSQCFDISINGIKGKIKTPALPPDFSLKQYDIDRSLKQPDSRILFNKNRVEWGKVDEWPNCESVIEALLIEFNFRTTVQKNKAEEIIRNEFSEWVARFNHNLYGFNYYLQAIDIQVSDEIKSSYNFYCKVLNRKNDDSFATKMHFYNIDIPSALTGKDLSKALSLTSNNKSIVLEYLFLKDAEIAIRQKNFRKAILDIATSFEVCLANYLRRNLKCDKQLVEELLSSQVNSLSKRRGLVEFSGMKLPKHDYVNIVDKKRNQAIHGGKIPSEKETKDALKVVKEVLEKLTVNKFE